MPEPASTTASFPMGMCSMCSRIHACAQERVPAGAPKRAASLSIPQQTVRLGDGPRPQSETAKRIRLSALSIMGWGT